MKGIKAKKALKNRKNHFNADKKAVLTPTDKKDWI